MTLKLILEEDGDVVEEVTDVEATGEEIPFSYYKKSSIIALRMEKILAEKVCEEASD